MLQVLAGPLPTAAQSRRALLRQANPLLHATSGLPLFRAPRVKPTHAPAPNAPLSHRIIVSASASMTSVQTQERLGASPEATQRIAQDMVNFINEAWTPFHAVDAAAAMLRKAGFAQISEREEWSMLAPGGKYYFTRNQSTLVAFAVGQQYKPGAGVYMVGAHTDSPCFKLKPVSKGCKSGYTMVNVEPYGGGLWHTWFDRDLGVAGRAVVQTADGKLVHRLVKIDRPILRIPMLAIHLQRDLVEQGFKPNKQTHCVPMLTTSIKEAAEKPAGGTAGSERHHPMLLSMLAEQLGCAPGDIVDFELQLCDTQPSTLGGPSDEFVLSGRLDNLAMSFCSTRALCDACSGPDALAGEGGVRAVALFDHEECGSASAQGAGGPVMLNTITRVTTALSSGAEGALQRALQNSFLVSADMAHALHPNYADKHEPDHQPRFGGGLVLKHNVNQRYATNSISAALFRQLARSRGIPTQEFCVRSDLGCGSTIGPILASGLGCRTVDVGAPQLAMHSIREMSASADVAHSYDHFIAFFEEYHELSQKVVVDELPPADIRGTIEDTPCECMATSASDGNGATA